MGPLEILVLGFPGDSLPDDFGAALERIQRAGDVRVVEALLITRLGPETVRSEDVTDLLGLADLAAAYGLPVPPGGLLAPGDINEITAGVQVDTTAVALLLEHRWAGEIVAAFRQVGGVVLASAQVSETGGPAARLRITRGGPQPV